MASNESSLWLTAHATVLLTGFFQRIAVFIHNQLNDVINDFIDPLASKFAITDGR